MSIFRGDPKSSSMVHAQSASQASLELAEPDLLRIREDYFSYLDTRQACTSKFSRDDPPCYIGIQSSHGIQQLLKTASVSVCLIHFPHHAQQGGFYIAGLLFRNDQIYSSNAHIIEEMLSAQLLIIFGSKRKSGEDIGANYTA
ncbi:uncharacterized protein AKAW2_60672A [Aspergillus luchuensis]|nr:uncharacterized protein AKAW2_60672A [Aspergillus luchuensis]BCS02408.1 hypothetical protein AKAW2_60672A [Aspergillus luchuensis]